MNKNITGVTYIAHSGFLTETANAQYLFDYYLGELPDLNPEKPLFVFSSHSHGDHFSETILNKKPFTDCAAYFFGNDIKRKLKKRITSGDIAADAAAKLHFMKAGDKLALAYGTFSLEISALASTDAGVAFVLCEKSLPATTSCDTLTRSPDIRADAADKTASGIPHTGSLMACSAAGLHNTGIHESGITAANTAAADMTDIGSCNTAPHAYSDTVSIYHAGDLNWWHWEGEDKAWNRGQEVEYKRELEKLKDLHLDLAFVPLDPRLEHAYHYGLSCFLSRVTADAVFPMHFWGEYGIIDKFIREHDPEGSCNIIRIHHENERLL